MHINFIEICETFYTHEERIPWVFKHPYLESTAIWTRTYTCVFQILKHSIHEFDEDRETVASTQLLKFICQLRDTLYTYHASHDTTCATFESRGALHFHGSLH